MSEGKDLQFSMLLDFYGAVLTEKQRDVMELYYNEDLSLGEIAEHENITRQGVRDSIKRGEAQLTEMEEKLQMLQSFQELGELLPKISALSAQIFDENDRHKYSKTIERAAEEIRLLADRYMEKYFN
ncbi:MAG TPA: putative DNA-binding protein [Firmicutes bacterium]|nr:putative DNA-binding protein [Bacillota bacterium]